MIKRGTHSSSNMPCGPHCRMARLPTSALLDWPAGSMPTAPIHPRHGSTTRVTCSARAGDSQSGSVAKVSAPAQLELDRATAEKVAPVVDALTNGTPRLLRDGRVVFVSTRDGLPALYISDAARSADPARKLPTPDERVAAVALLPGDPRRRARHGLR